MQDGIVIYNTKSHATPVQSPLRILGVYAHPDDETLCVGGTLAKYAAMGAYILIVSATQGEAGRIRDVQAATLATLGQARVLELRRACERLGVSQAMCFDFGDGKLMSVDRGTLVTLLTQVIREFRPDVVLTFGDDGAYGHPDHIAIGAATDEAFRLAGDPAQFAMQTANEVTARPAARLYHSCFPQNRTLLLQHLSHWLTSLDIYFRGSPHFVASLMDFAHDLVTMRYSSDYITVQWYPPGVSMIKQGETPYNLYLILVGSAHVMREQDNGHLYKLAEIGPGAFFGEEGIALNRPRNAHVIARECVSCLVFSPDRPTAADGRDLDTPYTEPQPAMTQIDVSAYVPHKVAAMATYRTQFPILPELFPESLWQSLFAYEYLVRIYPTSDRRSTDQL